MNRTRKGASAEKWTTDNRNCELFADVAQVCRPWLLSSQHCQNLIRRLHVRENPAHRFQLALMCLLGNLRHGVSDKDGAIVVLDPAAHGVGNANACGDACYNAGGDT